MTELPQVDLAFLPGPVRESARVVSRGLEVLWHRSEVVAAVDALADAGKVILGLDVRRVEENDTFVEVAWSAFNPSGINDVEAGRRSALEAVEGLPAAADLAEFEWVLLTWD